MKYNKQIMTEIHKANYIETEDTLFAPAKVLDRIGADLYYSESILGADIEKDDQGLIYIKDENGNKSDLLKPEEIRVYSDSLSYLKNTVQAPTKFIIIAGETTYTMPENYKPVSPTDTIRLTGINSVMFKTFKWNTDDLNDPTSIQQSMVINPPIVLNSLPNGDRDYLVVDSYSRRAYIIVKVGELILTGNESWEMATFGGVVISNPDNKDFRYVYKLPYDFGIYNSNGQALLCSHFATSDPNSVRMGSNKVSTARDVDDRGFMISMDAECLKDGRGYIENFKSYLRACYKSNNPVRILYKLKENRVKPIQIDDYALNGGSALHTYVYTNYPSNVAFGMRTIGELL